MVNFLKGYTVLLWLTFLGLNVFAQVAQSNNWQQEADYKIVVTLNDTLNQLDAFITIDYTNNSPQTLDFIYLHLWPNAYRNQISALAKQMLENGKTSFWYSKENQRGYIDSLNFKVNAEACKWQYSTASGEICKVFLNEPLKTGEHVRISTPFRVKLPETFSRMGHIGQSYQVTQWYPKPAVYDKYGWHPIPYLDQGEFYSEYGSFDVKITLPKNYVVGATGDLQDTAEINWMNAKADADAKVTGWSGYTDLKFPASDKQTKTLHYVQTRIHDFGWFADKRYHILRGEVELPHNKAKVTTWSLFTNNQAKLWAKAPEYLHDAIYYYSLWVGDYPYKQVTAVDGTISAGSGMEYPNVTVIGEEGSGFSLDDVITHEVGHNWFYGILGSNERDHAWMDEGINSFYEARYIKTKYPNEKMIAGIPEVVNRFLDIDRYKHGYLVDLGYQFMARDNQDQPIELTSEDFTEINYGVIVYGKTPLVFNYLEGYLGTAEFDRIMKKYYETWKFRHPQPEDVRAVFESETGKNLGWFFDDLMKTTKKLDYKITDVKAFGKDGHHGNKEEQSEPKDSLHVVIKNVNEIASPITVSVMNKDSVVYTKWFEGFNGKDTIVLPKLNGDRVQIDPDLLMPEVNRSNNTYILDKIAHKFQKLKFQFIGAVENQNRSQVFYAPYLGWNNYDKTEVGLAFYSPFIPSRRFEYLLVPAIGTGSKQFIGFARANYNFFTKKVQKITLGVKGKRFSYLLFPKDLTLNKVEPYLHFDLNKRTARDPISQSINLRSALVAEQWIDPTNDVAFANNARATLFYYVNEAKYHLERNTTLHPLNFDLTLQQGKQFIGLSAEAHFKISYRAKNQGLFIRVFAGGIPYYGKNSSDITAPLPNMYLSNNTVYNYTYWLQKDYMFDENFVDRNGVDHYLGRQVAISGGGFRSISTFGATNKFLASANFTSTIYRWVPFRPFASVGVVADEVTNKLVPAAELGISLVAIKDVIEIHLPLVTTNNIKQSQEAIGITKLYQKITFTLKLPVLQIGSMIRQFAGI
jgi:Peptidase family M1 domain